MPQRHPQVPTFLHTLHWKAMDRSLRLGYSPCPNDTFIFFALAEGRVDCAPYGIQVTLADVEELNRSARLGSLDVTKVSILDRKSVV